ncbi:hypothetical protein EMCRGX_G003729 [Ephydatia muelleri]
MNLQRVHGTQTHPSSEHLGSLALCFRTSASSAAAPTDMLASGRMQTDYGDVTVTSKAACLSLSQSNARGSHEVAEAEKTTEAGDLENILENSEHLNHRAVIRNEEEQI